MLKFKRADSGYYRAVRSDGECVATIEHGAQRGCCAPSEWLVTLRQWCPIVEAWTGYAGEIVGSYREGRAVAERHAAQD